MIDVVEEQRAEDRVFEYLKKTGTPQKTGEIQKALKLTVGQVAGSVYRLNVAGKIKKTAPATFIVVL